jgi:hypothetical protein
MSSEETAPELPEVTMTEIDEDDQAAAQVLEEDAEGVASSMEAALDPEAAADAPPEWATVPAGVKLPGEGSQIAFLRVPAKWTKTPAKGDRTCILWPIGETEEKLAYQRARGDMVRSVSELSKACLRAVDGAKADWGGDLRKPGSVAAFWSDIGPKGRAMIRNYYIKTHTVSDEEALDFFSNHFVSVTVRPA